VGDREGWGLSGGEGRGLSGGEGGDLSRRWEVFRGGALVNRRGLQWVHGLDPCTTPSFG
jgi:hypothetical protein